MHMASRNSRIDRGRMGVLIFGVGTLLRIAFAGHALDIALFAAGTLIAGAAWLYGLRVANRSAPDLLPLAAGLHGPTVPAPAGEQGTDLPLGLADALCALHRWSGAPASGTRCGPGCSPRARALWDGSPLSVSFPHPSMSEHLRSRRDWGSIGS